MHSISSIIETFKSCLEAVKMKGRQDNTIPISITTFMLSDLGSKGFYTIAIVTSLQPLNDIANCTQELNIFSQLSQGSHISSYIYAKF